MSHTFGPKAVHNNIERKNIKTRCEEKHVIVVGKQVPADLVAPGYIVYAYLTSRVGIRLTVCLQSAAVFIILQTILIFFGEALVDFPSLVANILTPDLARIMGDVVVVASSSMRHRFKQSNRDRGPHLNNSDRSKWFDHHVWFR